MPHDGRPPFLKWDYDRTELTMDAAVHAVGIVFALASPIAYFCFFRPPQWDVQTLAVTIYIAGLMTMLCVSAAYNVWPLSRAKWMLRRLDHSAIYLLIAATYTPFFVKMPLGVMSVIVFTSIWIVAALGIALKLAAPGRFDRLSICLYLLLGWSAVIVYRPMVESLSMTTIVLLASGGILYSVGVIFHVWQRLRFHNAVWHAFVLAAAMVHYGAVLSIGQA